MSARRQQWPRTSRINERYYAEENHPNFYQLKRAHSHFVDAWGREYTLATRNGQVFQNRRLQFTPPQGPQHCLTDSYGAVALYVKLPTQRTQWFAEQALHAPLQLQERRSGRLHDVVLRSAFKWHQSLRTGTVWVEELSEELCDELLNN